MKAKQRRFEFGKYEPLARGRQQVRGGRRDSSIDRPSPKNRGAVMIEANQDNRSSDGTRGAYTNRSPISAHRRRRSSYTLPGGGATHIVAGEHGMAAGFL
jgi:hypothetical protein